MSTSIGRFPGDTKADTLYDVLKARTETAIDLSGEFPVLPSYAVGSLPTGALGGIIMVTGASSGTVLCYYNGTNWIDSTTDTTVTA